MTSPSVFLTAPVTGRLFPISKSSDETFSQEILGGGFLLYPDLDSNQNPDTVYQTVLAPIAGQVVSLFPHAVAISGTGDYEGVDLLVHLGVETVKLKGEGFELLAEVGQELKQNDPWVIWDQHTIVSAGYSTEVLVVLLPSLESSRLAEVISSGLAIRPVKAGQRLFRIS